MSTFNELGERGLNAVLQARANMVGVAPSPAMMPEIGPTLTLENDRPEWGIWKNEFRFSYGVSEAALIGSHSVLWIPPVAGYIIVVNNIVQRLTNSLQVGWRTGLPGGGAPLANSSVGISTENSQPITPVVLRWGTSLPADCAFDTVSGVGSLIHGTFNTSNVPQTLPYMLRVSPNQTFRGLMIRTALTNNALNVQVSGYVRPENPNERLG